MKEMTMEKTVLILAEDAGPAPVALLQHGGDDTKVLTNLRQPAPEAEKDAASKGQ